MKKSIIIGISINLLCIGMLFFFFLHVEKNEFFYFLGNENITVSDIQNYMQDHERAQNIQTGKKKLENSGYASSGDFYITQKVCEKILPVFGIVLLVEGVICASLIYFNRKDENQKNQLERDNRELRNQNQNLEKHLINDKEQMQQYEENLYHQLKTPLTGLKLCLETIKVDPQDQNSIDMAQEEAEKMSNMITLFLKDRKMSANQIRFYFAEQDCILMMQEAMEVVKPLAIQKNKGIHLETDLTSMIIKCDETWLKESLITILENALEHGKDDTLIIIRKQAQLILIQVITTGMISEEEITHVFERFHTTNSEHYGIGLHMAKMIVENHHGSLKTYNIQSENKNVFEIKLPILSGSHTYDESEL